MKTFNCLYVPIGVPTFDQDAAGELFQASATLLKQLAADVDIPKGPLLGLEDVRDHIEGKNPDLIILQNLTFAHAGFATEVFKHHDVPVVLWTLQEPSSNGGRLRLNSLTGAFAAGFAHKAMKRHSLFHVIGDPQDEKLRGNLNDVFAAAKAKVALQDLNLASIGHPPEGFGFGAAEEAALASSFGVRLITTEARELMELARSLDEKDLDDAKKSAQDLMAGLDRVKEPNRSDFLRLYEAHRRFVAEHDVKALASRCWPDYFNEYKTPVCAVLSLLNDMRVSAACEADAYGALSMYVGEYLSGNPSFLGDPVAIDKEEGTITFWHCGAGACTLARKDTGACLGVHPNRQIGPTMEFGLIPAQEATIFRIGKAPEGGFRFFVAKCSIKDSPKQYSGTSLVAQVGEDVEAMVNTMVEDGWEPHYAVIYGDVGRQLELLAKMLAIPCQSVRRNHP